MIASAPVTVPVAVCSCGFAIRERERKREGEREKTQIGNEIRSKSVTPFEYDSESDG
jgi:hypothetical protein